MLVAALVTAACGGRSRPSDDDGNVTQVRDMFRERAARLLAGDTEGFLRPTTDAARPLDTLIAGGAAAVGVSSLDFVFTPAGPVLSATAFRAVPTDVLYRYEALPEDNVFRFVVEYDVERQGPSWTITGARPASSLPLWATGPVSVSRSDHFLALSRPGTGRIDDALALAEQARRELVPKLTLEPDSRHLLLLAKDQAALSEMAGENFPASVPAVAHYEATPFGVPRNRQMIVNLEFLFGTLDDAAAREHYEDLSPVDVFEHELAHLALTRYHSAAMPGWVVEGAAMFLAGERRLLSWREGLQDGAFEQMSFVELSGLEGLPSGTHYAYANAAVLHLVETFGAPRFWEFYGAFRTQGRVRSRRAVLPATALLQRIYGFDDAALDTRTRRYMAEAAGQPEPEG